MSDAPLPTPPREPEIEFLGKLAHGLVRTVRIVLWGGGAYALTYGFQQMADPPTSAELEASNAHFDLGAVWIALGLPLVVPSRWILSKGPAAKVLVVVFVALWFGPMLLENDSPYGYILRLFATMISLLSVLVWRTVWRLTQPDHEAT